MDARRTTQCVLLLLLAPVICSAQEKARCFNAEGKDVRHAGKYTIEVGPAPGVRPADAEDNGCRFRVLRSGTTVASDKYFALRIYDSSTDLDGDGKPDLTIEGYSGGAHCCWTYWFYSLDGRAKLLAKIDNERAIGIKKYRGSALIETLDGAFDYFDQLCHACTVFPSVYLQFRNGRLTNVSAEFGEEYDKEIAEYRGQISAEERQAFKEGSLREKDFNAYLKTKAAILGAVLAYFYSGREALAWKTLQQDWPVADYKRIRKLIIETRSEGVLRFVPSVHG